MAELCDLTWWLWWCEMRSLRLLLKLSDRVEKRILWGCISSCFYLFLNWLDAPGSYADWDAMLRKATPESPYLSWKMRLFFSFSMRSVVVRMLFQSLVSLNLICGSPRKRSFLKISLSSSCALASVSWRYSYNSLRSSSSWVSPRVPSRQSYWCADCTSRSVPAGYYYGICKSTSYLDARVIRHVQLRCCACGRCVSCTLAFNYKYYWNRYAGEMEEKIKGQSYSLMIC